MSPALNYDQLEQASTWEAASCLVRCKSCVSYKGKEYVFDTFVINETTQGSHLDQAPAIGRSLVKGRGIQDRLQLAFPDSLSRAVCGSGACQLPELPGNLGHQKPRLPPVPGEGKSTPCHWGIECHAPTSTTYVVVQEGSGHLGCCWESLHFGPRNSVLSKNGLFRGEGILPVLKKMSLCYLLSMGGREAR